MTVQYEGLSPRLDAWLHRSEIALKPDSDDTTSGELFPNVCPNGDHSTDSSVELGPLSWTQDSCVRDEMRARDEVLSAFGSTSLKGPISSTESSSEIVR